MKTITQVKINLFFNNGNLSYIEKIYDSIDIGFHGITLTKTETIEGIKRVTEEFINFKGIASYSYTKESIKRG